MARPSARDGAQRAAFFDHCRRIHALEQVESLLGWDQDTGMPPKGAGLRAEQLAAVAAALHRARTDPRLADLIAALEPEAKGDPVLAVNLDRAARMHRRAVRVPADLTAALARATSRAQAAWAEARAAADFDRFRPALEQVVSLTRDRAAALSEVDPYGALLEDYEPGTDPDTVARLFARLREPLVALAAEALEAARHRPAPAITAAPRDAQLTLCRLLGDAFGYDWQAGRLDLAAHPATWGAAGDVRITTRIDPDAPMGSIYATIHELGHALYEQGIDPDLHGQPAGQAASMGVHESQARLLENQIGRSRAFCAWFYSRMREHDATMGLDSAEALWRAVNRVEAGFIRVDADELHYNLHIMLRFDLERALIAGDLAIGDLEDAWNDRFARDFGRTVPDARRGVLQDVHWSAGLFGYFPTYTLGNVYAGALHRAMAREIGDLDERLAAGDLGAPLVWLNARVHRRGACDEPAALIARATGEPPDETALLDYLTAKYRAL